jgi:hypothetical protein
MLRGAGSRSGRGEIERTGGLGDQLASDVWLVVVSVLVDGSSWAWKASMTPPPLAVSRGSGVVSSASLERSTVIPTRAWALPTSLY